MELLWRIYNRYVRFWALLIGSSLLYFKRFSLKLVQMFRLLVLCIVTLPFIYILLCISEVKVYRVYFPVGRNSQWQSNWSRNKSINQSSINQSINKSINLCGQIKVSGHLVMHMNLSQKIIKASAFIMPWVHGIYSIEQWAYVIQNACRAQMWGSEGTALSCWSDLVIEIINICSKFTLKITQDTLILYAWNITLGYILYIPWSHESSKGPAVVYLAY